MTAAASPLPAPPRIQWRRAWRSLRSLVREPERTEEVFEIIDALEGNSGEAGWRTFCASAEGRGLLAEQPDLLAALTDRAALEALPEGSLGRAYAAFMREGNLDAAELVAAEEEREDSLHNELDPDRRWLGSRMRDAHDLWHVLTGYGRDEAGEAALLSFTWAQSGNRGIGLLVVAAAFLGPWRLDFAWQRYLYRAWRRGRDAADLSLARYEELLAQPLDAVRRQLAIEPPALAHPGGVVIANRGDAGWS